MKKSTTLNDIKDWNIYRRATEVGVEPTTNKIKDDYSSQAYMLLKDGKIKLFNERRNRGDFRYLNLQDVNLSDVNMSGADL